MNGERIEPWDTLARLGPAQPGVSAKNGDGSSFEAAFVVWTQPDEVVRAEEHWIFYDLPHYYGQSTNEYSGTLQRSKERVYGKTFDIIKLVRPGGITRTFYFDTSHLRLTTPRARDQ